MDMFRQSWLFSEHDSSKSWGWPFPMGHCSSLPIPFLFNFSPPPWSIAIGWGQAHMWPKAFHMWCVAAWTRAPPAQCLSPQKLLAPGWCEMMTMAHPPTDEFTETRNFVDFPSYGKDDTKEGVLFACFGDVWQASEPLFKQQFHGFSWSFVRVFYHLIFGQGLFYHPGIPGMANQYGMGIAWSASETSGMELIFTTRVAEGCQSETHNPRTWSLDWRLI